MIHLIDIPDIINSETGFKTSSFYEEDSNVWLEDTTINQTYASVTLCFKTNFISEQKIDFYKLFKNSKRIQMTDDITFSPLTARIHLTIFNLKPEMQGYNVPIKKIKTDKGISLLDKQ